MKKIIKILKVFLIFTILLVAVTGCKQIGEEKEISQNLLDKIKNNGEMTIGLMGTYPPYNFMNDNNEVDGFDADIAREISKRIGVEAKFITSEWSGIIAGLSKEKFDIVISQMTITDERKKTMDFSKPYIKNTVNIIVKSDNNGIQSIEDFKGKKIGVGLGTNDEKYLREQVMPKVGDMEIVTYNDVLTTLIDLGNGRIDATVNNIFAIKPQIDKNNLLIKAVGEPIKADYAGMAIRKGNPEFLEEVDKALTEMKEDGTYVEIFSKWFGMEPNL